MTRIYTAVIDPPIEGSRVITEVLSPKRPSDPPSTAKMCSACQCMKDDSGETYGWSLCHCGSFRLAHNTRAG